jgi:pyruvate/2-oxoglutarate dehydrogenase complex dihydrolipoamide acyltransferase (E2) component
LRKIIAKEGETVKVGEPIAIIARAHEELPDLEINDNRQINSKTREIISCFPAASRQNRSGKIKQSRIKLKHLLQPKELQGKTK